jgi:hypothetical protein
MSSMRVWFVGLTLTVGTMIGGRVQPQEPAAPQFRADTELVTLDVTVLDGRRRPCAA